MQESSFYFCPVHSNRWCLFMFSVRTSHQKLVFFAKDQATTEASRGQRYMGTGETTARERFSGLSTLALTRDRVVIACQCSSTGDQEGTLL